MAPAVFTPPADPYPQFGLGVRINWLSGSKFDFFLIYGFDVSSRGGLDRFDANGEDIGTSSLDWTNSDIRLDRILILECGVGYGGNSLRETSSKAIKFRNGSGLHCKHGTENQDDRCSRWLHF